MKNVAKDAPETYEMHMLKIFYACAMTKARVKSTSISAFDGTGP
jgi:hypothetical protein